jgi:chromosome segregation ATPase
VTEPGGGDERIAALEADVAGLRARLERAEQDAAAARILAGGADREVAEIRGDVRDLRSEFREYRGQNNRVLNAMRADLADLREHVDRGFARVDERFARVDDQFDRIDERFARVDAQFDQVDRNFLTVRGVLDGVAAGQQLIVDILRGREGDGPSGR